MRTFPDDVLELVDRELEVDIETVSPTRGPHRTTIWAVVADRAVYVRSVRGDEGRWYRELVAEPKGALHVEGRRLPFMAVEASDPLSVEACSVALRRKYADDPATPTMVRPETLHTTLRLDPD